ncbi:hypothetical protein JCM10213_007104 [Rhodosporidiobolus nylandii]
MDDAPTLFSLPPELIASILSHLDLPTLASSFRVNSLFLAVYRQYPNHISRAISIRTGLADVRTGGASARLNAGRAWAEKALTEELEEDELKEVVQSQGTMMAFDEVQTWEEYARARFVADQNWRKGRCSRRLVELDVEGEAGEDVFAPGLLWRFKLDAEARLIVATGLAGGCFAYTTSGDLAWSCLIPVDPYPHVELSEGYISLALPGSGFLLLRRSNLPAGGPILLDPGVAAEAARFVQTYPGHALGYEVECALATPTQCGATKMRFPYLVASTRTASEVCRFDIRSRKMRVNHLNSFANQDVLDEGTVHYIEVDSQTLYLAGQHSFTLWRNFPSGAVQHESPAICRTWPPSPPPEFDIVGPVLAEKAHYRDATKHMRWSAVHHDAKDLHLVGICERGMEDGRGKLLWTVDFQKAIWEDEREVLEQKTVVLTTDHADLVQLAVENDRAVFVASSPKTGSSLWLLNLRQFRDHADFSLDPPKPICIAWPLPLLEDPSRVEITSTEIFLPALRSFLVSRTPSVSYNSDGEPEYDDPSPRELELDALFAACEATLPAGKMPLPWKWETLDGQTLADYSGHSVDWSGFQDFTYERDLAEMLREDAHDAATGRIRTELEEMEHAWDKVKAKAEEDGEPANGGTDAMCVYNFAETEE